MDTQIKESNKYQYKRILMIPIPLCVQLITVVAVVVAGKELLEEK